MFVPSRVRRQRRSVRLKSGERRQTAERAVEGVGVCGFGDWREQAREYVFFSRSAREREREARVSRVLLGFVLAVLFVKDKKSGKAFARVGERRDLWAREGKMGLGDLALVTYEMVGGGGKVRIVSFLMW